MRRRGDSRGRRPPQELGRRVELARCTILVRAKARARSDLDAVRRHAETVLAEAEAAHAETEAYRAEIDANVDRIERAKTYAAERDKLSAGSTRRARARRRG